MSLINQMLVDLDKRGSAMIGAEHDNKNANIDEVLPSFDIVKPHKNKLSTIQIVGFLIGAILCAYLWSSTAPAQSKSNVSATKEPIRLNNPTAPIVTSTELKPLFERSLNFNTASLQVLESSDENNRPSPSIAFDNAKLEPKLEPIFAKRESIAILSEPLKPANPINKDNLIANNALNNKGLNNNAINKLDAPKITLENIALVKQTRPEQQAANLYRQAIAYLQQGRVSEAQASLAQVLDIAPANLDARQMLASLLIDNKRIDEAKALLTNGIVISPQQADFRIALARIQLETGDLSSALNILEQGLSSAKDNADYQEFLATILQRAERHDDAISHYTTAIGLNGRSINALVGLGISLQAVGNLQSAQSIFTRAQSSESINPQLAIFVEQRLKQINQRLNQ